MASRTFTVLAPNGRRQTVRCTINTTILQILEDVCKKQGLNSSEYDIKHHNKVLDTSLTVQFSGLPNNAQLELATSTKTRIESEITVAIIQEDGSRVMSSFMPSKTLQEILDVLHIKEPNPVVIYMRQEIYGEELAKTDLRSLGLTSGRAMFRLIHKTPDELKTQANVSNSLPAKPITEKPYKRVFQPVELEESGNPSSSKKEETTDERISFQAKNFSASPDILKLAKEKIKSRTTSEECSPMDVTPQETEVLEESRAGSSLDSDKAEITRAMEESQNENMKDMKLEDFPFTGIRNGLIYSIESNDPRPIDDPPDEFFNLTINDAKMILRDVRKNAEEEKEGKPLLTSELRSLEESKKQLRQLNKYRKCIIRVLFPNRVILQGVFAPKDSIKTVSEFVKEHLAIADTPFYLYTTPPKCILPEDKMLIEVDCVPVALLHFGLEDKFKNDDMLFLREDLKDKFTTSSVASLAAKMIRKDRKDDIDEVSDMDSSVAGCSKDFDSVGNATKRNLNSSGKVPKWFKGT